MHQKVIFSVVFLMSLNGCAVAQFFPAGRLDTPEVGGRQAFGRVDVRVQETYRALLDGDGPVLEKNKVTAHLFGLGGSYGLSEKLDLVVRQAMAPSPTWVGLKYQFLGNPLLTSKTENILLAMSLLGGYGLSLGSREFDDGSSSSWTYHMPGVDLSLIGGLRMAKQFLVYGSLYINHIWLSGGMDHEGGASPGEVTLSGDGGASGACLGTQISFSDLPAVSSFMGIEIGWRRLAWENLERSDVLVSANYGFNW